MDALKSLVQPLVGGSASSSMIDGMKLVVLGGTVETARRVSSSAWSHFVNSFFLTAHFSEEDFPYDWLMLWLSRRPEWQRSREFDTTTRTTTPGYNLSRSDDNSFGDEDIDGTIAEEDIPGKVKTRVVFQPTFDTTHTIYYRGHWLRVKRGYKPDGSGTEMLSISVVARNNSILKQLVLQAKKEYEAEAVHRIQIYFADSHGGWRWTDSRHKRPMSSIVLNPGVKEMLLNDAKDFLKSEKWYADRGIPFRRGYLLHGVPGSGKSSLISAIAGELMLDIYAISLSSSWMNDSTLQTLMGRVPARCILLLEDLDAAFTRSVTRDQNSTGAPGGGDEESNNKKDNARPRRKKDKDSMSDVNTLSLSGLLNSLDGVAASEGRLLFATTNHLERLDPALSRPGRMDVWIEFRNASKWQAEALFRNFFPSVSPDDGLSASDDDIILDPGELEGIEIPTEPPIPLTPHSTGGSSNSSFWPSPSTSSVSLTSSSSSSEKPKRPKMAPGDFGARNSAYLPPPVEDHIADARHSAKPLDPATLARLAKEFADGIPEEIFSVASLQGYLLKNKSQPEVAAKEAATWVKEELAMQAKLKREREERQQKLKEEREQKKKDEAEKEKEKSELEKKEIELNVMRTLLQQSNPNAEVELKKKIEEEQTTKEEEKKKKEEEEKKNQESKEDEEEESEEEDEDENSPPRRSKWE